MTCDLCYSRKEKCVSDIDALHCRRCVRLGIACTTERRQQRPGRRPRVEQLPSGTCGLICFDPVENEKPLLASTYPSKGRPSVSGLPRQDGREILAVTTARFMLHQSIRSHISSTHPLEPAIYILNDPETFYRSHSRWMIGRSFNDQFQRAVRPHLSRANGILLKAYGAIYTRRNWRHDRPRTQNEIDASAISECLNCLLRQPFGHPEDVPALLMLSQVLFVYHVNYHLTSAHPIVRSAMFTAAPYYKELLQDQNLDPITVTPVLIDTLEAVIRRELPSVKIAPSTRCIIDRTVGLCWPLLLLLQELCECSHRQKLVDPSDMDNTDVYADIQGRIEGWEPVLPPGFFDQYPPAVTDVMFFQARLYRAAALLIIHRLKYPLGVHDEEATPLAEIIILELFGFLSWASEDLRNLPVGLPLLVAALESRETCMKIIPQLRVLSRNPKLLKQYVGFIDLAWIARKEGYGGLWFDLVDRFQPPIII